MKIADLIRKKKLGGEHSKEEINYIIESISDERISDYQLSAWLMAVYFQGMTNEETFHFTESVIESGDIVNLGELTDKTIDICTTGGVGDKATIATIPLLVAAGVPILKLLGRGLGHTGGTIDKLESVPGFNTRLAIPDMINQLQVCNCAISSQVQSITPVNRTLQALKYLTATEDSMSLIASSVVSKKVATGAGNIIIDVKYGSGVLTKTLEDAIKLSNLIICLGKRFNKSITTIITSMDEPLGRAVGNTIEVIEAIEFLKGNLANSDLAELVYDTCAVALLQLKRYDSKEQAIEYLKELVSSGAALEKCREIIHKHRGNVDVIDNYDKFNLPRHKIKCKADTDGFVQRIDAYKIAYACKLLGAVRDRKNEEIDKSVGIFLNKKTGEAVTAGDTLFTIYINNLKELDKIKKYCYDAYTVSNEQVQPKSVVYKIIRNE